MGKTLIIYTHIYDKSFNHAILEETIKGLKEIKRDYAVIDLHADGFDPRYTTEELRLFHEGGTTDPLVTKYQKMLKDCDRVIVIYPIWWGDMPALLKGFFDKVMKVGHTYVYNEMGQLVGTLTNIKKVTAITTMMASNEYFVEHLGNSVQELFLGTIWNQLGVKDNTWLSCDASIIHEEDKRIGFLASVHDKVVKQEI